MTSKLPQAFAALGHPIRLEAFRLFLTAGAERLSAGEFCDRMGVRQNTGSGYLRVLEWAGLLTKRRAGRSIRYTLNAAAVEACRCCFDAPDQMPPTNFQT